MKMKFRPYTLFFVIFLFSAACSPVQSPTPTPDPNRPKISSVVVDSPSVARYGALEMIVSLQADYTNPYDSREVRLDTVFMGPEGQEMSVPGFWDGDESWKVRFTPSSVGEWRYSLTVTDHHGTSEPSLGSFAAGPADADRHGWIQTASWVNSDWSSHYFIYHDGTPFYGIGHCDALNILIDRFTVDDGVGLLTNMNKAGENFVVWWPMYSNSLVSSSYDSFSQANMAVIDMVVKDAEKKNLLLIFTIWDHPELRASDHAWGNGQWRRNGFSKLSSIDDFFTAEEPWAWQENLYRYIIARWGYSPSIAMWQTVSEVNGTNAYGQTNVWHKKMNAYFLENDPYRHPTTASMSGDVDWPAGFKEMDVPQVHVYDLVDVTESAETLAHWTQLMWQYGKPNWVGEFGVTANASYPELFHHSIWAALGAGAAMTPAEWNSGGSWGRLTPEMLADLQHLKTFVDEIPLAHLNPSPLSVKSLDSSVRGWGVAGDLGGLLWVQDFSLQGKPVKEVREQMVTRSGVIIEMDVHSAGTYVVRFYDTWQGVYLAPREIWCDTGKTCILALPDFRSDLAAEIKRK